MQTSDDLPQVQLEEMHFDLLKDSINIMRGKSIQIMAESFF